MDQNRKTEKRKSYLAQELDGCRKGGGVTRDNNGARLDENWSSGFTSISGLGL